MNLISFANLSNKDLIFNGKWFFNPLPTVSSPREKKTIESAKTKLYRSFVHNGSLTI